MGEKLLLVSKGKLKSGELFSLYRAERVEGKMARRISEAILEGHGESISLFRRLIRGEIKTLRALSYFLEVDSRIVSQVTVLGNQGDRVGILSFVATLPEFRRKGAATQLLELAVGEFFAEQEQRCLLLHASIDTFRRQLYEKFGFHIIGSQGLMGCLGNLSGQEWEVKRRAFEEGYFERGEVPARAVKLSGNHLPGLNLLFAAESGWSYRSHRYGIIGPSQVEMKVYQMLADFTKSDGPGEARVLLSGKGNLVGIFLAGPDPRFGGKAWTLDLFVHSAFEEDAGLLVSGFAPKDDVYIQAYSGTSDARRVAILEALGLKLRVSFPGSLDLWSGR